MYWDEKRGQREHSQENEAMYRDIHALNDETKAASVRIFVGGLRPARQEEHHPSRLGTAKLPTWVVTPLTSVNRRLHKHALFLRLFARW